MATDENGSPRRFLGQAPLLHSQLRELETLNVQGIVNLCDEYKGLHHVYRKKGISLLWLKTVAHHEPTVEAMRTAVSFIEHHRKRGGRVYIHCRSGRGRSAAIAMGWLMQVKRMRPLEANLPTLLDCALIVSDCTVLRPLSGEAHASPRSQPTPAARA